MSAYATGNDLIERYDIDLVGDLGTDNREPVDRAAIPSLPFIATALLDASGEIDVALQSGARYSPADLAALTGNSVNKLKRITCDIAMALLLQRRTDLQYQELAERVASIARSHLAALARGENVFGIPAVTEAGIMSMQHVSSVDIDSRNNLTTRMSRVFPVTDTVIPRG